jgi:serine/threonine-protein kinase
MTPTIGSIVADRFELVRELGRGSMGSVWLANHLTLHVRCALKFMSGDLLLRADPSFRTRFEFEARAIAQLQSPHVVRILDYSFVDDVPFIAMEYLQGEDLSARLSRAGTLDAPTTYRIVSQVARGLAKAHMAQLVHRDIKPENIFLAKEDEEQETVKLLDFGVAKSCAFAVVGNGTRAGALIGSPAYMSPEQVHGTVEIDHRSDLWSLAVVAYQCLTGKLPFDSEALGETFAKIMYEAIPVPSAVAPWLTPKFDAWWVRAASRRVDDRFSSARELAVALGEALAISTAASEVGETGRWMRLPFPSARPPGIAPPALAISRSDSKAAFTTTQSPLTRSLRGARELMRSRLAARLVRVGIAAMMALVAAIGLSDSPAGPKAAAAWRVASVAPAASRVARRVAADAAPPQVLAEQAPHTPAVRVNSPPVAPPDPSAKPAPPMRTLAISVSRYVGDPNAKPAPPTRTPATSVLRYLNDPDPSANPAPPTRARAAPSRNGDRRPSKVVSSAMDFGI